MGKIVTCEAPYSMPSGAYTLQSRRTSPGSEILSESIDVIKSYKELVEEIIDEYGLDIDED